MAHISTVVQKTNLCYFVQTLFGHIQSALGRQQGGKIMGSTYCNLLYHAVFSTKDRKRWLDDTIRQRVYDYMGGTIREKGGVLIAANGTDDHVHLLLGLTPQAIDSHSLRRLGRWAKGRPDGGGWDADSQRWEETTRRT